jgi:hypothetical protein
MMLLMNVSVKALNKTYTLLIGLTHIDDITYHRNYNRQYSPDATAGVPNDINRMKAIGQIFNHEVQVIMDEWATHDSILGAIKAIGSKIDSTDNFIFYFSGHGDLIPDNPPKDEDGGSDQCLVAFDKYIVDDEIYALLRKYFTKNFNLMIMDACHSSTMFKFQSFFVDLTTRKGSAARSEELEVIAEQNKALIDCEYTEIKYINEPFIMIYFGAAGDYETAQGYPSGGLFTNILWKIFQESRPSNRWMRFTYRSLACEINRQMSVYSQNLQYHEIGKSNQMNNKTPFKFN